MGGRRGLPDLSAELTADPTSGRSPADVALLVNPTSGRGRGARWIAPVLGRLEAAGHSVDVLVGSSAAQAIALAQRSVDAGAGTLMALGGDGLVHLAIQVAAQHPVTLSIVPAGTGNDFARALGLPRGDPAAAVDVLLAGHTIAVDAASVDSAAGTGWFGGVLASGFDSQVNERANAMRGGAGRARYTLAMVAELRTLRAARYELTVDGVAESLDAVLVAVGNTASYGAGMRITPAADPTDGLLDVTIVGPVSRHELLRVFPRIYSGSFVRHPAVRQLRGRVVELAATGAVAYADGERIGPLPVTATAVPGALRVAVPDVARWRGART